MIHKIQFSYISQESKDAYEKHGGFANSERLLFLGFKTETGFITGIKMEGGLYSQIHRHFNIFVKHKILIPSEFSKFVKDEDDISYRGIHATNIARVGFNFRKYRQKAKIELQNKFINYLTGGNPIFQYSGNFNPEEIEYINNYENKKND